MKCNEKWTSAKLLKPNENSLKLMKRVETVEHKSKHCEIKEKEIKAKKIYMKCNARICVDSANTLCNVMYVKLIDNNGLVNGKQWKREIKLKK